MKISAFLCADELGNEFTLRDTCCSAAAILENKLPSIKAQGQTRPTVLHLKLLTLTLTEIFGDL